MCAEATETKDVHPAGSSPLRPQYVVVQHQPAGPPAEVVFALGFLLGAGLVWYLAKEALA